MQYSRKMGIDFGDKRIGVAFSDLLCMLASAFDIVENVDEEQSIKKLTLLAKDKQVDEIVLGLPLNIDGTENDRTKITRDFGEKLQKYSNIKVVLEDERLSSIEAEEMLKSKKMTWEQRKKVLDMWAAQVILQSYLDHN